MRMFPPHIKYIIRNPGKEWEEGPNHEIIKPKGPGKKVDVLDHIRTATRTKSPYFSATISLQAAKRNQYDGQKDYTNQNVLLLEVEPLMDYLWEKYPNEMALGNAFIDVSDELKFYKVIKEKSKFKDNLDSKYVLIGERYASTSTEVIFQEVEIPKEYFKIVPWKVMDVMMKRYDTPNQAMDKAIEFTEQFQTKEEMFESLEVLEKLQETKDKFFSTTMLISPNQGEWPRELDLSKDLNKAEYIKQCMEDEFPEEKSKFKQFINLANKRITAYFKKSSLTREKKEDIAAGLNADLKEVWEQLKYDWREIQELRDKSKSQSEDMEKK